MAANRLEDPDPAHRDRGSRDRTDQRDDGGLDEHLAEQPHSRGPERRAHRVLTVPLQPARDEQARHVDRGHQEQQRNRPEQRQQQPARVVVQHLSDRPHPGCHPGEIGFCRSLARRERRHLGLGLRQRGAVAKTGDRVPAARPRLCFIRRERQPEVHWRVDVVVRLARVGRVGQETNAGRHDADDGERGREAADLDRGPDDCRVSLELTLPELVTQDDAGGGHFRPRRFRLGELTAVERFHADGLKVVAGDHHAAERPAAVREHEEVERPAVERRRLERPALGPPLHPLREPGALGVGAAVHAPGRHQHQPIRRGVGRGRQQHAVDQPEHRRCRADAQRQGDDGRGGKSW